MHTMRPEWWFICDRNVKWWRIAIKSDELRKTQELEKKSSKSSSGKGKNCLEIKKKNTPNKEIESNKNVGNDLSSVDFDDELEIGEDSRMTLPIVKFAFQILLSESSNGDL